MMTDRAKRRLRNEILIVVTVVVGVSAAVWTLASP
jgi:hypothetical protein